MPTLVVKKPKAVKKTATPKTQNGGLEITSWKKVCAYHGVKETDLPVVNHLPKDIQQYVIDSYKLAMMVSAVNEGWTPDWSDWNQYKYYPWLEVKTKTGNKIVPSGFAFSYTDYDFTITDTSVGSRLVFKSSEHCMHSLKYFIDLYVSCKLIVKQSKAQKTTKK